MSQVWRQKEKVLLEDNREWRCQDIVFIETCNVGPKHVCCMDGHSCTVDDVPVDIDVVSKLNDVVAEMRAKKCSHHVSKWPFF